MLWRVVEREKRTLLTRPWLMKRSKGTAPLHPASGPIALRIACVSFSGCPSTTCRTPPFQPVCARRSPPSKQCTRRPELASERDSAEESFAKVDLADSSLFPLHPPLHLHFLSSLKVDAWLFFRPPAQPSVSGCLVSASGCSFPQLSSNSRPSPLRFSWPPRSPRQSFGRARQASSTSSGSQLRRASMAATTSVRQLRRTKSSCWAKGQGPQCQVGQLHRVPSASCYYSPPRVLLA